MQKQPQNYLKEQLEKHKPAIAGLSVLNANRFSAFSAAAEIKKFNKNIKTVFGGPCATFLPEYLFKALPELDYIIPGEGEFSFIELYKKI